MTIPDENSEGPDTRRTVEPLGGSAAPPADPESHGGSPGPAGGIAGPSYPPAETEPDAQQGRD